MRFQSLIAYRQTYNFYLSLVNTKETGKKGEIAACRFLEEEGYTILAQNYRQGIREIDIIASDNQDITVFVEVKSRYTMDGMDPEQKAGRAQMARIADLAGYYMEQHNLEGEMRFDVIGVRFGPEGQTYINHYKDVFFPGID